MSPKKLTVVDELFMTVWIIVRVAVILVVWLALFLALFLGIFTVPLIVVVVLASIYAIMDVAFVVTNKVRSQALHDRGELLGKSPVVEEPEPEENLDSVE